MAVNNLSEAIGVASVIPRLTDEMVGMLAETEEWLIRFQGILAASLGEDHETAGMAAQAVNHVETIKGLYISAQAEAYNFINELVAMQ